MDGLKAVPFKEFGFFRSLFSRAGKEERELGFSTELAGGSVRLKRPMRPLGGSVRLKRPKRLKPPGVPQTWDGSLDEGHGFSRAAKVRAVEAF